MLSNANLPNGFWAEAVATAVHLINRSPNKAIDEKVPKLMWLGKQPSYKHLRVLVAKHIAIFLKILGISWRPSQRSVYFLAMVILVRWDTVYGSQRAGGLCVTMMST